MSAGSQIPLKGDLESSAVSSGLQRCPRADGEGCHRPMRARRPPKMGEGRGERVRRQRPCPVVLRRTRARARRECRRKPLPCTFPDAPSRGGPHEVGQAVREPPAHVRVAAAVRPALVGRGWRGRRGLAGPRPPGGLFAAAPAGAQNLQRPVVTSTPASGNTYLPGETIVVQVRPRSSPWVSITSATGPTLGLNVGGSVKSLSGTLQSRRFSYTYYDTDLRETVTRSRGHQRAGVPLHGAEGGPRHRRGERGAANALGGGNIGANVGGSQFGGGTWFPNLSKNHSAMSAQSDHRVDTPAPSWSGGDGSGRSLLRGRGR